MQYAYLTKRQLCAANRRAIKAGARAIEPTYLEQLPEELRYPVFRTLPWERHGWVRCWVGTATDRAGSDYTPLFLDVPQKTFDNLSCVEVRDEEVAQSSDNK